MRTTWLQRMVMALVLAGSGTNGTGTEAAVLVGFISSDTRMAVQRAVDGATRRLTRPECQRVFGDFSFAVPAADQFAPIRFIDDPDAPQCKRRSTLAFTERGGRVVHICGNQFRDGFQRDPARAEIIVIHELLHVIGLGENPPTSEAITAQVAARCAL